jgi:hypothetical protein
MTPPLINQQTITIDQNSGVVGTPLPITFKGGSGEGRVVFALLDGECTLDGNILNASIAGKCVVGVTKAGDAQYNPAAAKTAITFSVPTKINQEGPLLITSLTGHFGTPLQLTSTGGSSPSPVEYVIAADGTATDCAINASGFLTTTSGGTCIVAAKNPGDSTYHPIKSEQTTITINSVDQAPLILANQTAPIGTSISLATSGGSGNGAVTYAVLSVGNNASCSISGSTLNATYVGTCQVIATKAAEGNYNTTSSAPATMTFAKAAQVPLTLDNGSGTFGNAIALVTNGGSGSGATSFAVTNGTATGCSLTSGGNAIISSSGGTCFVSATKAEDSSFLATSSPQASFMFERAEQNSSVTLANGGGVFGTPYLLVASGGTGTGAYSYAVTISFK